MICLPDRHGHAKVTDATPMQQDDKRGDSTRKQIRLPTIAPKDDQSSSGSSRSVRLSGPAVPPRARLPPRSRNGCWTCRLRKVKCDEARPTCGQCHRLGHVCDYSPRLSFRDDTTRVLERMEGVTAAGSGVWDRQYSFTFPRRPSVDVITAVGSPTPSSAGSAIVDDLPAFATLTTDEERERKAEASSPGTYQVVVNPNSFQHLPEYSEDVEIKRERLSPLRRSSIATSLASSLGRDSSLEVIIVPGDPNTIVLPRFEDLSKKPTRELKSPISPISQQPFIKLEEPEVKPIPNRDSEILGHFRDVVWRQLVPTESEHTTSVILLDEIAVDFPPLLQAMLAIASQSLAQRNERDSYAALQHYTKAISYLKEEENSASDGVFLTHFLMLIYEIATADTEHSLIRTYHLSMLLKLALLRRNSAAGERFPFIIWRICTIDLDSLFSGTGSGDFVTHMLENDLIPPPSYHIYPLGQDGSSMIFSEEKETLPTLLTLDYEVTVLAIRLAMLSQEFRQDDAFRHVDPRQRDMTLRLRHGRIYEIQEALRQLWAAPRVLMIGQVALPPRSQRVWEHAYSLFKACIIYSHTSMWPGQRMDTLPDYNEEISFAAGQIIQMAQNTLFAGHLECRFLVLPVLMAGISSSDGNQRMTALNLIARMEQESIGKNTAAARILLQRVYDKQHSEFRITGHSLEVDWMETMLENGLTVINFGM